MLEREKDCQVLLLGRDLFRLLVEGVEDYAIFALDPKGYVSTWNAGAQRIKGYAAEEIIGRHFSVFYPPPDIERGKPEHELKVAADEGRWEEEGWRIRKDGSRFRANVVITALTDEGGQLVGFAKVTRDLTERRQAEEERARLLALERAARAEAETAAARFQAIGSITEAALARLTFGELLQALIERVSGALVVDTAAIFLREGDELVARAARGLEAAGVRIAIGEGFAGLVAQQIRPVIIDDVYHADVLIPLLREAGVRSLLGVPLVTEGRVLGVLHVGTLRQRQFTPDDVHLLQLVGDRVALAIEQARLAEAERRAREQEAALRARDDFLTVAAHELKTPMTSLQAAVQFLLRQLEKGASVDSAQLRRALLTIERQASRQSRLVTQLLETSRLERGRLVLDRCTENLTDLVAGVVDRMQVTTSLHQLVLSAPPRVLAVVDALRLEQVLTNLLDNAIKYSPDGGRIDVELSESGDETVRLAVRDRGLGISEEQRERIFDRFYQAHRDSYRSGMGLGLYISRQIAELHGGSLAAEIPRDGGARFVLTLPADLEDSPPQNCPASR
jgi:PAS domain S-box-containing protein